MTMLPMITLGYSELDVRSDSRSALTIVQQIQEDGRERRWEKADGVPSSLFELHSGQWAGRLSRDFVMLTIGDDLVGVGAQVFACLKDDCNACSRDLDPHCPLMRFTYNTKYADGHQAHGGYAEA
ncbi:hypothetical protein GGI12_003835, partial [Dipsacomyces acuminosporus]